MAKVTGPLMSLDASGSVASTITFSKWKGRNYVRQTVTPNNPNSAGQEQARNFLRVAAAGVSFTNLTSLVQSGETDTDKVRLTEAAPSDQAWNGYLTNIMIGAGGLTMQNGQAAFAALEPLEKTAWDDAADALVPPIASTFQSAAGGIAGTPLSSGETFFLFAWGLSTAGLAPVPGAVPTVYA